MAFTGERKSNSKGIEIMTFGGFMFWMASQVVGTGLFAMWYMRKHPEEAMKMMAAMRSRMMRK